MQEIRIKKNIPDLFFENLYPHFIVSGIDESGRGPIAGPVVAAIVVVNKKNYPKEINDSKKLSKKQRKFLFEKIRETCFFAIGIVDHQIIDKINILQATKLAMFYSYQNFCKKYQKFPEVILVDGNFKPFEKNEKIKEILPIIKGDQKSISIAAASIVAKETRDEIMLEIDQKYPQFGFAKHAGYPTKFHIEKVKEFNICEFHRKSFEPIKSMLNESN
jgi:ribonuclease HII